MPQISADGLPEFKKQNNPITLPAQPPTDEERTVRAKQGITTEGVRMVHIEQGTTSERMRMISAGQGFSTEYGVSETPIWRPTPPLPPSILMARLEALRW
ncbi:MAG TPA: hypothetical protein VNG51_03855 [Ktedonobacteraceae bacterium]|nr:hypothetical protein [Ktedonobacteraceae bacterium]